MRGLGDFQRAQMRDADRRFVELFGHLRRALDTFEQIMLRPYQPHVESKTQPSEERNPPASAIPRNDPKLAYSVKEVRNLIGISRGTIYKALGCDELKAVKLGNRTLILAKDLREWLEKLPSAR